MIGIRQRQDRAGFPTEWCVVLLAFIVSWTASAQTGSYQVVSVRDAILGSPVGGAGDSGTPVLSSDGRYVLFSSSANNLVLNTASNPIPTRVPARLNVYLKDRVTGSTELVSVDPTGTAGGDGDSLPTQVSTNGRFVLFESTADNLVNGDTNEVSDVFVRDRINGTTVLVSRGLAGGCGNGASYDPVMTPDGRYVAFAGAASNLVTGDTNGIPDVFVRDLLVQSNALVSVGAIPTDLALGLVSGSESPDITPDGHYVAFRSTATNLVAGVTNANEVYVRNLSSGTVRWVSTNVQGILQSELNVFNSVAVSYNHHLSSNGQFVAFQASAINASGLPASAEAVILRHDLASGMTEIVATNAIPALHSTESSFDNLSMTPDGRFIAFLSRTNGDADCVRRWDALTGTAELVSGTLSESVSAGTICKWPVMDASGRYVAFLCNASGLTTNAVTAGYHLYVRDMMAGTTELIDGSTNGAGDGLGPNTVPSLSEDGTLVAFECPDSNLVENDRNHDIDVFVKALSTDDIELVSAHHPELPSLTPNGPSLILGASISSNGQFVAFASDADNLVPNDTNGVRDIFVRDLVSGTNILVTVSTNGGSANGISTEPVISGNGRYVAFTSYADNLVVGDTNKATDVFVRDLLTATTLLVSVNKSGTGPGDDDSFAPSISADGHYILFESTADNMVQSPFSGGVWLLLRDTVIGTNLGLALLSGGGPTLGSSLTSDGRYVAFSGSIPDLWKSGTLYVWDTQIAARVYTNSSLTLPGSSQLSISPDGQRLAYVDGSSALRVIDWVTTTNRLVDTGVFPVDLGLRFSKDGRFLTYAKRRADSSSPSDVFIYDFESDTKVLVSRGLWGLPDEDSGAPDISSDGRFVAYRSWASDIVSGDLNGFQDIFLFDRLTEVTTVVSASRFGNAAADNHSMIPWFSADGSTLVWTSWASDLEAQDENHLGDVFTFRLPSTIIVDVDGDGMDDQWEMDHFMTTARDGTGDYDNDGASDLFEFQTGTDPTDPGSLFYGEIVFAATPSPSAKLTWTAAPGKGYRVEWKDALADPEWHYLDASMSVLGVTGTAYDLAPSAGQRFYRIALISP